MTTKHSLSNPLNFESVCFLSGVGYVHLRTVIVELGMYDILVSNIES